MDSTPRLGRKIQALRDRSGLSQAGMAERLGISPPYLSLIEHDHRPLTAPLLIKLAQQFDIDLRDFASDQDNEELIANLHEIFGDPLFEAQPGLTDCVGELATLLPEVARAVLRLHEAYSAARDSAQTLAERAAEGQGMARVGPAGMASEEVSDMMQRHYFPELEAEAQKLWRDGKLATDDLFRTLAAYLDRAHSVQVRILKVGQMRGAERRFDPARRELSLSETLAPGSRTFQVAAQIGLLHCSALLDTMVELPQLSSPEARALGRVSLANYFASAVLMPYDEFLRAAEEERYDIELLGHRFGASFEQICQRLTTLRRPGAMGVPFYMVRIDIAGNIWKKFSTAGIHFPRFSSLCPLWNVHRAFLQQGTITTQVSRLSAGTAFLSLARTAERARGDYHGPRMFNAIEIGCDIDLAKRLVYADGMDLGHTSSAVPVGMTCRLCPRMDCQVRALPFGQTPVTVDENARGISFYAKT